MRTLSERRHVRQRPIGHPRGGISPLQQPDDGRPRHPLPQPAGEIGVVLGLTSNGSGPAVFFAVVIVISGLYASYAGWDHRRKALRDAETAPPATRDKPLATRLTTLLFFVCSFPASPQAESMARLGGSVEITENYSHP